MREARTPDEAELAAAPFRLAIRPRNLRGRSGDRRGQELGASIDFEDHRAYQFGDDPRRVDWRAYARTDKLAVRTYREEVSPSVDLIIDRSASMAVDPTKWRALADLTFAFSTWVHREGGALRVLDAGGAAFDTAAFATSDETPVAEQTPHPATPVEALCPTTPLRPRGLRILVSDLLLEGDLGAPLRRLAEGAAGTVVVQLLTRAELEPESAGPMTLIDAEAHTELDVLLDRRTIAQYIGRLRRHRASVETHCQRLGVGYAMVTAAAPTEMIRNDLMRQGVVEPA